MSIQRRRWQRLERGEVITPSREKVAAIRAEADRFGMTPDQAERLMNRPREVWQNDRYTVIVERDGGGGWVRCLSVRRNDRGPDIPWRHLQRIKSQLAGDETEAVELYPAESRLVDTANQRWLWCLPPGEKVPLGINDGRHVLGPEDAARVGARQAGFEDD